MFLTCYLQRAMARRLTKRYLTEAEEYDCPLSEETQKIAEHELRETENSRSQALIALRSWMEQNPKFMDVRMGMLATYYLVQPTLNYTYIIEGTCKMLPHSPAFIIRFIFNQYLL